MAITVRAKSRLTLIASLLSVASFAVACGDVSTQVTDELIEASDPGAPELMADDSAMSDDGEKSHSDDSHGDGEHGHGMVEVNPDLPLPALNLTVVSQHSGWLVHAEPTNHKIAPLSASTDAVDGEGHMHLFVDDVRVARLYNEWFYIDGLEPGDHTVRVELSANNHSALTVDGKMIDQAVDIVEPDSREPGAEVETRGVATGEAPTVEIVAFEDPKSGWNVNVTANGHDFAPELLGGEHVDGEGHLMLYVDGEPTARLLGGWFHLGDLEPGEHELSVRVMSNDGAPLSVDGSEVESTTVINQTAA